MKAKSKFGKLWREGLNKVQDVIADERTQAVTSLAASALDIASKIGQAKMSGPLVGAAMVLGTIDEIRERLNIVEPDPIEDYLSDHEELVPRPSGIPFLLTETGAIDRMTVETLVKNNTHKLVCIPLPGDHKLCFKAEVASSTWKFSQGTVYVTDGLNLEALGEMVWESLGRRMAKLIPSAGADYAQLEVVDDSSDPPYVGIHDPAEFARDVEVYHSRGISRSEVLVGPGGSGKTSFVRAYCRLAHKTLLVVPPHTVNSSAGRDVEAFVNLLRPGVLLLDDIHEAQHSFAFLMNLTDDLRRRYPKMVIISTTNRIIKENLPLMRPGRLGETLEFLAPGVEDRVRLLELYLGRYGVDAAGFDTRALAEAMDHKDFTHDYVRFTAEQAVVKDQGQLMQSVLKTVTWLQEVEESTDADLTQRLIYGSPGQPPLTGPDDD